MRAFLLAFVVLAAPFAAGAANVTDADADERMRLNVATASVDPRAGDLGCRAPAVDIQSLTADAVGNDLVLRLRVTSILARPTCANRALDVSSSVYHLDLEGDAWAVSNTGGSTCNGGQWSCIAIAKHGAGGFYEAPRGATGQLSGSTWTITVPLVGTTVNGKPYDLRGATYDLYADGTQKHTSGALTFFDTASDTGVQL